MTAQKLTHSKHLAFNERWYLCIEYLKHHKAKYDTKDGRFFCFGWFFLSALIIFVGTSNSGFKGFIHSTSFIGSLWWLFYFLCRESLFNTQLTRQWLAYLMASIRLSKNEFDLFETNLDKSVYALQNQPYILFITYGGIILFANQSDISLIFIYVMTGLVHAYFSLSLIKPFLNAYSKGQITAVTTKRLISLVAWQKLGGVLTAAVSLIIIQTLFLLVGLNHQEAVSLDTERCYQYFMIAVIVYFLSQVIPVIVSLIVPAFILNKGASAIFLVLATIGLVILGTIGLSTQKVFLVGFIATIFWNIYTFFSQKILAFKFGAVLKSLLVSVPCLGITSVGLYFFELAFRQLGLAETSVITFCIFLTCSVWIDCVVFGFVSSFEVPEQDEHKPFDTLR